LVTITQLAHACALLGLVNYFALTAARTHLASQPVVQEKIVCALLTPLLIGDVFHMVITVYALGDGRWDFAHYTSTLWMIFIFGFGLLIPRTMWHMGIGRFMEKRDGKWLRGGASASLLKT
jgi:hypothetical protein